MNKFAIIDRMTTITIPRKLIKEKNLILVPREEYEGLLRLADRKKYTDLDRDLDKSIAEYRAGKAFGPFGTVKSGITFLESQKVSRKK